MCLICDRIEMVRKPTSIVENKNMKDSMVEKSIHSDRGDVFYWISKTESVPTIFFLHGVTANHTLFEKQIEAFGDKYNIIVWDCPCHGKSRPYEQFTYTNVATEIKNILDAENINEVILVGQSLGGMIAQYFISLYPDMVRGLIAIDSAPFGDYYSKSDMFWLSQLEWMSRLFPNKLLRILMAKACGTTEYAQRKMIDMLSDYDKKELCHLLYIGEAAFIQENKVIDIKCPIILIVGEKDRVGKVYSYNKEWTKRIGCDLHIIKGAGHNANEDCPDEVNEIIENFFRS